MSPALRPATVEALQSFRQRRTKLLMMRSVLVALCVLLLLLLLISLLDRATFMPDGVRQALSYAGYAAAIGAAWWLGVRFIKETRQIHKTAALMENADPALRERLLSAVELSEGDRENDSAEFRGKLQDEVAAQLVGFKAESVLPGSLLAFWKKALAGVAVLIAALCFVPDLHVAGFMARAALPFANLERPSSVKIKIVTPVKPDALVPMVSSVPLGVQIDGKMPGRVTVETRTDEGKSSRMELTSSGANRFEGSITIGQTSVHYRVKAGDAITAWHTMEARPRPRVLEFAKTVTPPAYTGLPATTVANDSGDVTALEGSTVTVTLKTNQPIEKSAATLSPDAKIVEVKATEPDKLVVSFAVDGKADGWQVALTAKESGFSNDENAAWRIETQPDLPPVVAITSPSEQVEVRSDDLVQIVGNATDDVGLAKVELSFAINGTDWKDSKLMDKAGKEAAITTPFKLAPLPVKTGDAVLVKLVATDLKGQRAESLPVRLFVVEDKLNLAKHEWASKQRDLAEAADALAKETRELRKDAEQARKYDRKARKGDAEMQAETANARVKQDLASVQEKSKELWEKLKETAKSAPDQLKSLEANLVGQKVAALRGEHLKELNEQLHAEQLDEKQLKEAANMAAAQAEAASQALRAFAAADTAQAVKESLEQLAPQQNRLADKAIDANRDPASRAKWQEQQRAAVAAAENAREDLEALKDVIQDGRKRDVDNHLQNFNKKLPGVKEALDSEKQHQAPEFVYGQAHELRNAANQARDASRWFADETAQKANEMRERMMQQQNPALAALENAKAKAEQAVVQKKDKPNEEPKQQQAADKLAAAARQFKDQSELREQNHQTNTQAALDLNRMGRALDNVAEEVKRSQSPEELKAALQKARDLSTTAQTLQADAQARDAALALDQSKQDALAQTDPREQLANAQAAANQLKELPRALRQAQADNPTADAAQQAANNAQWQRDELQNQQRQAAQQKQNGQENKPLPAQQNKALEANANAEKKLEEAMEKFAPKVADARQALEQLTPKLSELAKNTANEVRDSQKQTAQTAQQAKNNQAADQTAQQANALLPKAADDAQKLADLQAALRQEADKADLANEAQRQMARTADVGLEQIRRETPKIAGNLEQAAKAQQADQQAQALDNAAKAQQQTADALQQLAQNLSKMEKGEALPQDALAAQQAMEEALGIKQPLDQSYNDAKQLAQIMQEAQDDPQKALAALEQELKKNPAMQRALADVAQQTAAETNNALAMAQTQPQMAQPVAEQSAHELERVARHEQRLDQKQAAAQVTQASQKINAAAKAAKSNPAQNNAQTAEQSAQSAQAAQQAASEAAKAVAENAAAPNSFLDTAKGAMLAQALDELDQAVNAAAGEQQAQQGQQAQNGQQQGQQQGQQKGQQSKQDAQQSAQQSLAQANQAQAQSMAQARAQGMVPGQKPQQGQQPGQQPKGQQQQQESPDATGNLSNSTFANLVVPNANGSQNGDWGHLPSRMAKDLTEASRQEPSPEYRAAIESYYKAIAEKAKR
jgi:hypothetical protein